MKKARDRTRFSSRPLTPEEIAEVAEKNGVKSLDDAPPPGTKTFHGYGELLTDLEKSSKPRKRAARS